MLLLLVHDLHLLGHDVELGLELVNSCVELDVLLLAALLLEAFNGCL